MSGSSEVVCWNACMNTFDLDLYSHPKGVFLRNGVRTHVNTKGKKSHDRKLRGGLEPATLHHARQRAHTLPIALFRPPPYNNTGP